MPSPKRRSLLARAVSEYAECVEIAQDYLTSRGFTAEVVQQWQLGYVLDPLPGHERFKGRLAIPYLTPAGPVKLKFRCLQNHDCKDEGHPKYDQESSSGTYLYGANDFALDSSFICITEGELDKLSLSVAGVPSVGIDGANKWLPHWAYCFEGYEEVIVLEDGDEAGAKFVRNVTHHLYNTRVITFPEGEDVNSYLVEHGPEALRRKVGIE